MARQVSERVLEPRDPSLKETDAAALRAIAQGAVDVELFTIPLYMTSLYSIVGTHEINDAGQMLYKGWTWPGAGPTPQSKDPSREAFNIIYSIFVEEMLHLQLAANMATVIGLKPSFTSTSLQSLNHGWVCYGENNTIIPNIIDLADTTNEDVRVNIGALDEDRVKLFLAIEQPDKKAYEAIKKDKRGKYFPKVPFAGWAPPQPLPLFGTIGHMYQCYYDYLHIEYTDGTSLWRYVYDAAAVQRDYFNSRPKLPQYGFALQLDTSDSKSAYKAMCAMMDAITDQGEGSVLDHLPDPRQMLKKVESEYQAIKPNLEQIYPSYDSNGNKLPDSARADARCDTDAIDHYDRFKKVRFLLPNVRTWAKEGKVGKWTAKDFVAPPAEGDLPANPDDPLPNPYGLPTPDQLAGAWNAIAAPDVFDDYYKKLSQAVIGAIAGMTTVLDQYWSDKTTNFPSPAMGGTGDRMLTIWAALGKAPNLALGLDSLPKGMLAHSCQGLSYDPKKPGGNDCARVEVFHSCIGSNNCHAEGGCGFVNKVTGGGSCGGGGGSCSSASARAGEPSPEVGCSAPAAGPGGGAKGGTCGAPPAPSDGPEQPTQAGSCGAPPTPGPNPACGTPPPPPPGPLCGSPTPSPSNCGRPGLYSAPGDNKCASFGGCAVPISASQLYPPPPDGRGESTMEVFDFKEDPDGYNGWKSVSVGYIKYKSGDKVEDVAYRAFAEVMKSRGVDPVPPQPEPNVIRLVFPPST